MLTILYFFLNSVPKLHEFWLQPPLGPPLCFSHENELIRSSFFGERMFKSGTGL